MAGLIFKAPYYKPKHKTERGQSRGGFARYIATRDGVEILRSGMAEYIGERRGSHGMFTDEGEVINLSAIGKEIDEHTGNIWGLIFSLTREDADRLGYNSDEEWMNLLRSRRNDIAKEMNIAPENLRWYAAFHNSETHPHVHMLVWSKNPKEPYLSTTGIYNIKHTIAGDIYRQEHLCIYRKQTQARDDLKAEFRDRIQRLSEEIKRGFISPNAKLVEKFSLLCEALAGRNVTTINRLDKKTKALVNDIVKAIAVDQGIAELYDLWYKYQCEIYRTYTDDIPAKIPLEENEVFKSVRNNVVSTASSIGYVPEQPRREIHYDYKELKEYADDPDYLIKYAELENRMAMYRLGRYYLEQTDETEDAEYWLEQAANNGCIISMYEIYRAYRDKRFYNIPSHKMKYLRMAVDSNCFFAEYEYSKILKRSNMKLSREYLERAAKHGSTQAQYELGKILFSEGKREEAREWFERSAQNDAWTQTSVGILLCYEYKDYEKGKEYIYSAIEQGYEPAKEAIKAINKNLNAQIIFGVCNLLYYASGIIEERVDDMHASEQLPTTDKKQRREIQEKKQGIIMSEM